MTYEAWVRVRAKAEGVRVLLLGKQALPNNIAQRGPYPLALELDDEGVPVCSFRAEGAAQAVSATGTAAIVDGSFHHLACVRDGHHFMKLYVDGVEVSRAEQLPKPQLMQNRFNVLIGVPRRASITDSSGSSGAPVPLPFPAFNLDVTEVRVWSSARTERWVGDVFPELGTDFSVCK